MVGFYPGIRNNFRFMAKNRKLFGIHNIDILLMSFIFLLLFMLPVLFTKVDGGISWTNVFKIWQDRVLLIPIFIINHWVLVPRLMLKKRYKLYTGLAALIIMLSTLAYYFHDIPQKARPRRATDRIERRMAEEGINPPRPDERNEPPRQLEQREPSSKKPSPVPPYADLLMFSLLIVAVDTGLSLTKNWHRNEEDKIRLEKENTKVQLAMLRNQVSPHFFMNTLNNIYALIDTDTQKSKQAVMKLSKLMRYMLYENSNGKVTLSKEFEFIKSYVDLMIIRFDNDINVNLDIPEKYTDVEIPVMLFISYIENAFKYGASYQQKSFIHVIFEVTSDTLSFTCLNSITGKRETKSQGGLGLQNSKQRLELLFNDRYKLSVRETEKIFTVELNIPLA